MVAGRHKLWVHVAFLLSTFLAPHFIVQAQIRTGAAATDLIGQYDQTQFPEPAITFAKDGENDSANRLGMKDPVGSAVDSVNHRLFVVDTGSNRVLVYTLDSQNRPVSRFPANVLGQPDFASSAAGGGATGLSSPERVAYSPTRNLLFVTDFNNSRVVVYDVSSIQDGQSAAAVLGQPNLTTTTAAVTSSGMGYPRGVALDDAGGRLFVAMELGNRVLVFDINVISNGESATHVLGRADFTSSTVNPVPNDRNFYSPNGMAYDATHGRLFVADSVFRRVLVFDVNTINNNENATQVIGQNLFTTDLTDASASGCGSPTDAVYDGTSDRLFVVDNLYNRVQVYLNADPGSIVSGMAASATFGQTTTSGGTFGTTQTQLDGPIGLALTANSATLYVVDSGNNRVMVFDSATATTNEPAIDLLGQYDETSYESPVVKYTKAEPHNSPNLYGLGFSYVSPAIDATRHRLFVTDGVNNRILMFNLNEQNELVSKIPAAVLGQTDFASGDWATTQTGLRQPRFAVYDNTNDRLFVSDSLNSRVLVFDTTTVTNGQAAAFVIGQPNFTSSAIALTQTGMAYPRQLALDEANQRLFVADDGHGRVTVYDVSTITNGEPAVAVLGKPDFTTFSVGVINQSTLGVAHGLAYDPDNQRLFVSDPPYNRVLAFDVASITNGEAALAVLCQGTFNTDTAGLSDSACESPRGLAYDTQQNTLYLSDYINNRVLAFGALQLSNGEAATHVLGQTNFTSSTFEAGATKIRLPDGLSLDTTTRRLYVGSSARVLTFPTRYAYDYSATTFTEAAANDGSVSSTVTITLTGDQLPLSWSGALVRGVHYTITGVPAGLTEVVTMNSRKALTLSFTGAATAHESANSVSNVQLTFLDAALTTGPASAMQGYEQNFAISFNDAPTPTPTPTPSASACFGGVLPKPTVKVKGSSAAVTLPTGVVASAACSIKAQATSKQSKKPKTKTYRVGKNVTTLTKLPRGRWSFAYQVTTTALGSTQTSAKKSTSIK